MCVVLVGLQTNEAYSNLDLMNEEKRLSLVYGSLNCVELCLTNPYIAYAFGKRLVKDDFKGLTKNTYIVFQNKWRKAIAV